jgi:hypothetical protein
VLVDIRTALPFYVGETLHPRKRYAKHIKGSLAPVIENYAKQVYIRSLIEDGLCPSMVVIDSIESDCKQEVWLLEEMYADFLRQQGIAAVTGGPLESILSI